MRMPFLHPIVVVLLALALLNGRCLAQPQRVVEQTLQDAHRAWRAQQPAGVESAAAALRDQPLAAYPEYWQVILAPHDAVIRRFLERYPGTVLAEKLREDWVRGIAKRGEWALVLKAGQGVESPPPDVACWLLRARHAQGDDSAADVLLREHWPLTQDLPNGCLELAQAMAGSGRIAPQAIWQRARGLLGLGEVAAASRTLLLLPTQQALTSAQMNLVFAAAPRTLSQTVPRTAFERELLAMAWVRSAQNDSAAAATWLEQYPKRIDTAQRAYLQARLGLLAAQSLDPSAANWFTLAATAPGTHLSDEHRAWWVRSALRQRRWGDVRQAIAGMSLSARQESRWQYWLGRAEHATGDTPNARGAWRLAAREHGFYGRLAQEALKKAPAVTEATARQRSKVDLVDAAWQLDPIELSAGLGASQTATSRGSDLPSPATPSELKAVAAHPGIAAAVTLQRAGLTSEAAAEWQWALRRFSDRQLLAAAHHAKELGLWNRMLDSMERIDGAFDPRLRYPTPHAATVRDAAQAMSVDPALVFAVIRQESRFWPGAVSNAGARGLMQLMPATGRWLADEQGWRGYTLAWLDDPSRNITLGTRYLRRLRGDLGQTVLAIAGYNAGPGRALAWRGHPAQEGSLEGAVYVESIPLAETRDYVKRVATAWLHYSEQLSNAPHQLTQKLGVVPAGAYAAQLKQETPATQSAQSALNKSRKQAKR